MSRYIDADKILYTDLSEGRGVCWVTFMDWIKEMPTADVVEADKAQKEIDYWHDKAQSYEQTILKLSLNKADVVEVVRCKDCKWWDNEDDAERCTHKYNSMWAKPDEYCSYGERKEV